MANSPSPAGHEVPRGLTTGQRFPDPTRCFWRHRPGPSPNRLSLGRAWRGQSNPDVPRVEPDRLAELVDRFVTLSAFVQAPRQSPSVLRRVREFLDEPLKNLNGLFLGKLRRQLPNKLGSMPGSLGKLAGQLAEDGNRVGQVARLAKLCRSALVQESQFLVILRLLGNSATVFSSISMAWGSRPTSNRIPGS